MNRPGHIKCIRRNFTYSWCGESRECVWTFDSTEHALATVEYGSWMLPCPECCQKIIETITPFLKTP